MDFHACRVAYTTFVIEGGATVKEAQARLRHSTPALPLNTYGRDRQGRLSELTEKVGKLVSPGPEYAVSRTRLAAGAEGLDVTALDGKASEEKKWWRRGGSNPRPVTFQQEHLRIYSVICCRRQGLRPTGFPSDQPEVFSRPPRLQAPHGGPACCLRLKKPTGEVSGDVTAFMRPMPYFRWQLLFCEVF